jgi:hypothetical protein
MRATLNLPDTIIEELMRETGENNRTRLIKTALEQMLKKIKRDKLKKMRGKIDFDLDLRELREKDLL